MCACIDHLYSEKTVTDSYTLHKMLLVVFLHHRALLSLPQVAIALIQARVEHR